MWHLKLRCEPNKYVLPSMLVKQHHVWIKIIGWYQKSCKGPLTATISYHGYLNYLLLPYLLLPYYCQCSHTDLDLALRKLMERFMLMYGAEWIVQRGSFCILQKKRTKYSHHHRIWAMAPCTNAMMFLNLQIYKDYRKTLKLANKTHCGVKYKMVEQTLQIYL